MSTPKQHDQQRLRQALGTVKGFHGYLHNLRGVVAVCIQKEELLFTSYYLNKDIDTLSYQLKITEEHIKRQLRNLDKLFPAAPKQKK